MRRVSVLLASVLLGPLGLQVVSAQNSPGNPQQSTVRLAANSTAAPNPEIERLSADVPSRLPDVMPAAANARIARLEAHVAELQAQVQKGEAKSAKADAKPDGKKDDGYVVGSDTSMSAKWNYGLELQSKNKDFRVHVGGRTQWDNSWFSGDPSTQAPGPNSLGPLRDASNFRRGRLRVDGTMYEVVDFACEYDFVNTVNINSIGQPDAALRASDPPPQSNPANVPALTELWITATQLPVVGNVRIGQHKDAFGFEHLTSSRFLNFMERSFAQDLYEGAFNNGFLPGVSMFNTAFDERMTWNIGEFKNSNNIFGWGVGDGEYETCGRMTWLPYYQDDGRYLLHVGAAGKYQDLDENQTRFRARGDIRSGPPGPLNPVFANTGNIQGKQQDQIGLELVGIAGPWSFQSEYFGTAVQGASFPVGAAGAPLGTYYTQGGYAEAHYFLTGESRPYNRKTGVFDRVIPLSNFFFVRTPGGHCGSWGAWQATSRYQYYTLRDQGLDGGILQAVTVGLNWFWNPNLKIQANYDWTHRDFLTGGGSGVVNSFGTRVAFDF